MKTLILLFLASMTLASDYAHECSNAWGSMKIYDGQLQDEAGLPLAHEVLQERVLSHKMDQCFSQVANRSFAFENKVYLQKVRYTYLSTEPIEEYFVCELAASGVPAGINDCE